MRSLVRLRLLLVDISLPLISAVSLDPETWMHIILDRGCDYSSQHVISLLADIADLYCLRPNDFRSKHDCLCPLQSGAGSMFD